MGRRRILFVHTRFPGQYAPLARALALSADWDVCALTTPESAEEGGQQVAGVPVRLFRAPRVPPGASALTSVEGQLATGAAAARAAAALASDGFRPDVVLAHTGWGAGLFLKEALPETPVVKYFEWFYLNANSDADFLDPDRPLHARMATSALNLPLLGEFATTDAAVTPTRFQASRFPDALRSRLEMIPDGVDVGWFAPDPDAVFALPDGRRLTRADRVVTYVARGADPYRGFRPAMEAIRRVQAEDPSAVAVVLGDDRVHYGPGAGTDRHRRETLAEVRLDPARTHFLGRIPLKRYRRLLQVSAVHIHLSVPFVMSWSLLEAMAAGCLVVGSANPPVTEVIADGVNGLLVPFHDPAAAAAAVLRALGGGDDLAALRRRARDTVVDGWSADRALARHLALIERVTRAGRGYSPSAEPAISSELSMNAVPAVAGSGGETGGHGR